MEREKGKKNPNAHRQSIRAMLFLTEITKERNATQKCFFSFQENGKL